MRQSQIFRSEDETAKRLFVTEEKVRKKVMEFHQRGRVDLFLSVSGDFSDLLEVKINLELAKGYQNALAQLSEELGVEEVSLSSLLLSYPDILSREQKKEDFTSLWPIMERAIDDSLTNCDLMRCQEGEVLAKDLRARLQFFTSTIDTIEAAIPELLQNREKTLQERLDKILNKVQLDPARLAQEVAIIADKSDVTEEIVRLRCHIQQFELFLTEGVGIGRKLDFLIQEFLREVNTLASKINDATIAHHIVDLKSELEKMREQVQNIE